MRATLRMIVSGIPDTLLVAEAPNGEEVIALAKTHAPDIILMDINMPPINGFEATQKITEACPSVKIIGISINNNPKYAVKIIALGARGFVTKTSAFSELKTAIHKVYNGETFICQEINKKMAAEE